MAASGTAAAVGAGCVLSEADGGAPVVGSICDGNYYRKCLSTLVVRRVGLEAAT